MSREELLNLLLEQTRRANRLEKRVGELEKQLADRTLLLSRAGTMAEAALALNGVFEAADRAAEDYVANIRKLVDRKIREDEAREDTERIPERGRNRG